jgi:hypothetical protein
VAFLKGSSEDERNDAFCPNDNQRLVGDQRWSETTHCMIGCSVTIRPPAMPYAAGGDGVFGDGICRGGMSLCSGSSGGDELLWTLGRPKTIGAPR